MTRGRSLKLRLMLGAALAVVAAVALAGLFIANLYRIHTTESVQQELLHHLDELAGMTTMDKDGAPRLTQALSDPLFAIAGSGFYWQINGEGGHELRSLSLAGHRLVPDATGDAWQSRVVGGEPVQQHSVRWALAGGHSVLVTVATAQALIDAQVVRFHDDLTRSMIAMGVLLLGGALALVWLGLAPVRRLGEDIERLRHGEVERLDPNVPTELAPVVKRFNALLDGQAQLIARARAESGNLAHNLRTPLALITDEAEQLRLAGQETSGDFLLARCEAMQLQIDHHLARAAAAGTRGAGTLTEVAPLVDQIVEAMRRLHMERGLDIMSVVPAGLWLPCDRGDLAEILSNLIDNGCKWARGRVVVSAGPDHVEVRDDGPGIPEGQRACVATIGTRLDMTKPGSGLGLAATTDLLRFYDARLELGVAPEGGLSARAVFGGGPQAVADTAGGPPAPPLGRRG